MQLGMSYRSAISLILIETVSKFVLCSPFVPPGDINIIFEPFQHDISYRYLYRVSFQNCLRECWLRSRCLALAYYRIALVCGILDVNMSSINPNAQQHSNGVYVDMANLDGYTFGDCAANSCGDTEKCEPSSSGIGFKCEVTECLVPEDTVNGHTPVSWSTLQVGASAYYECQGGLATGSGSPLSVCLANGTWSIPDLQCGVSCSVPAVEEAADFVNGTGPPWTQGSEVTYECSPGFYNETGGTFVTSTCGSSALWFPKFIVCCPDGWLVHVNGSCIRYYNGSGQTNLDEIANVCDLENANVLSANHPLQLNRTRDLVLERHLINQTIMNAQTMMDFTAPSRFQALRDCMDGAGHTPLPTETYAEVILTAKTMAANCPDVDLWATNEPTGTDNCTAYGHVTGYLLTNVPCTWSEAGLYGFICTKSYENVV